MGNRQEKQWVSLDPDLSQVFGVAGQLAIETVFNAGITVIVPPEVAAIQGMLGPTQRRVNLDQTARNILADPRPDELEQLAQLVSEEDRWTWALEHARQIALVTGYLVDS